MGGTIPNAGQMLNQGAVGSTAGAVPKGTTPAVTNGAGKLTAYDPATMAGTAAPGATQPQFVASGMTSQGVPDYVANWLSSGVPGQAAPTSSVNPLAWIPGGNAGAVADTSGLIRGTKLNQRGPIARTSSTPVVTGTTPPGTGGPMAPMATGGPSIYDPRSGPAPAVAGYTTAQLDKLSDAQLKAIMSNDQGWQTMKSVMPVLDPTFSPAKINSAEWTKLSPQLRSYAMWRLGPGVATGQRYVPQNLDVGQFGMVPNMDFLRNFAASYAPGSDPSSSLYPGGYGR